MLMLSKFKPRRRRLIGKRSVWGLWVFSVALVLLEGVFPVILGENQGGQTTRHHLVSCWQLLSVCAEGDNH